MGIKQLLSFSTTIILLFSSCSKTETKKNVVQEINPPTETRSEEPFLFVNKDQLYLSWIENTGDSIFQLKYSTLRETNWQTPLLLSSGTDWFVNWADFPAIVENKGKILSHVLTKSAASTYAYDIHLILMERNGQIINPDFLLNNDGTPTEHGFVTMLPYKEDFFVTWLDGRNTVDGSTTQAMNLRAATVTSSGEIINDTLLDTKTCDCCQTSAAITTNGPIVVYRDRSSEEVRDISIVRYIDGKWTQPKNIYADNWQIQGCPVNGPKASAMDNNLVVAWFTAANDKPTVKLIFSNDGGKGFSDPLIIGNLKPLGRVDVVLVDKNEAVVSWMESVENGAEIRAIKVNASRSRSKQMVVASAAASRSSGFPQMELLNDKLYFSWTDLSSEFSLIKTASIDLDTF